jgi:acyl-CoA synthetase (NDP forming)
VAQRFATHLLVLSMIADTATRKRFEALGYLVFENPERAVGAVAALAQFARQFGMRETGVTELPEAIAAPAAGATTLDEAHSKRLLAQAGIPVLDERMSHTAAEAAAFAAELGFPVAMKILSPDILHKSDIGGVLLGIPNEEAAMRAFRQLHAAAQTGAPGARIEGVLVAPMVDDGVEMIVGCDHDAIFGPVVMLGLGGIFVEALASTALRMAPIDHATARSMIDELQGAAVLRGLRGKPSADIEALAGVLVNLSRFAASNAAWLASVDINPLVVRAAGCGVVALDAVVLTRG